MNKPLFRDTNLNDYIKVKLTEKGINILRKKYGSKFPINIDDEGYTKFQMWDFARIFGEHLFMTAALVCQTSVQVQVKPDDEDLLVMVEKLKEDIVEYKAEHDKQLTKAKEDCKTAYIKGMRHLAKALKNYDRTEGAWTDYFEHTVDKVLKRELSEVENGGVSRKQKSKED